MSDGPPSRIAPEMAFGWFFAVCLLVSFGACATDVPVYVFRYSHTQQPEHPRSKSMRFFEETLEERTVDRIQVENYFSGLLGTDREGMDLVATGVIQGTRGGLFADASAKYHLFMLPFLVENWDQALRLINSPFTQRINRGARANHFHIPACGISQGFRAHTNSVRPIHSPQDLRGLKMRVPPQEIYVITALAFGVNPQEINYL